MTASLAAAPRRPRPTRSPGVRPAARAGAPAGLLVAVCAAEAGAGAGALSRLLALSAAGGGLQGRVLLCRQPGPATRPWAELTPGQRLGELFVRPRAEHDRRRAPERLRIIAAPAGPSAEDAARFALRLARARARYALTVVDCATLGGPGQRVGLAHATHLVWVLEANRDGVARARRALARARVPGAARELLVARRAGGEDARILPALRALAAERPAPLILAPRLAPGGGDAAALERCQVTLQALLGALTR